MKRLYYLRPSTFSIEVLAVVMGVGSIISGCNAVSTCTLLTTFRMSDAEDVGRLRFKCDGTRAETRFHLSAKRRVHLYRRGRQFSRLLAAEVCASAVVMLHTPYSEVV